MDGLGRVPGSTCAIGGLTFRAPTGQITGLLAPNGAGESTTMRMLATLLQPDEGCDGFPDVRRRQPRTTSMSVGPGSLNDPSSAANSSSVVVTETDGTPIPVPSETQSR